LERAGTGSGTGVITALYTVLVEGDDLSDPIADTVRSILDGHVVLSRSLAERGHFPAIDVLQSISRLAPEIATEANLRAAGSVREMMSAYREAQDLIQVGAYASGSDARVDVAINATPHIDAFLKQRVNESSSFEEAHKRLAMLAQMRERGLR
jgi:flagellum-specific ATP synthase